MNNKYYERRFKVHLGDTSAYSNAYYLTYHRWIAFTKEDFFLDKIEGFSDLFNKKNIKLFVLKSSLKIFGECKLHDEIAVKMTCARVKKLKAELLFECYDRKEKKIAESENTIIFVDARDKLMLIPDNIRDALISIRE